MKKNPARILQVLTTVNRGGAENMIMNYYRAVDRTQVQFDFLLHRPDKGAFEDEISSMGGNIYKLPPISITNLKGYEAKLDAFFKEHPEYKVVHSHLDTLSYIILRVAKRNGIKVRISHSHLAIEKISLKKNFFDRNQLSNFLKDLVKFSIRRKVLKEANHYFACSEKAGVWLFGENEMSKVKIINNAINNSTFTYNKDKALRVKKELNLENCKLIGHVGRFDEQKNHTFLIDLFHHLIKKDETLRLLLIGDGILAPKIKEKVNSLNLNDKVFFLGVRNDVPDLLQGIDLLLFPSLFEGLPVSLVEAQASGLKIVTSSNVSKEVKITNLVSFYDLDAPIETWVNGVLNDIVYTRKDMSSEIKTANYDIKNNAEKLQDFYLEHHNANA